MSNLRNQQPVIRQSEYPEPVYNITVNITAHLPTWITSWRLEYRGQEICYPFLDMCYVPPHGLLALYYVCEELATHLPQNCSPAVPIYQFVDEDISVGWYYFAKSPCGGM